MTEPVPVIAVTYSKRAPLGNISSNLPVQVRQSNRLHVVASAENPLDKKQSEPKSIEECKSSNIEVRVDASTTVLKAIGIEEVNLSVF